MSRSVKRWAVGGLLVVVAALGGVGRAHAEPSPDDKALATVLFQQGRTLMSAGKIPEACLKLEESERLDPGGGTILNLALCHEQEGRLARSWSEFNEAVVRARKDGRRDREVAAAEHALALEPRLSKLTVAVPAGAQVPGLQVERDGRELGRGAWSTAMPVDGGEHVVRATAPGKAAFTAKVVIGKQGDAQTIEIPVLATPVVVVTPPSFSSSAVAAPAIAPAEVPSPLTARRLRWAAIGTAGAGVVMLGTAGYMLATALSAKNASNRDCMADVCGNVALQNRTDAVSRGNLATILGIGGAVLVGTGATLFYLGHRSSASEHESAVRTGFLFGAAPGLVMTGIGGRF